MKLALRALRSRLTDTANLINACWFVTYRCNAACVFCEVGNKPTARPELDHDRALRLIDEMAGLDVRRISLVGGEPLVRKDLPALIRRIRARGMTASLVTNGFRLRDDVVEARPHEITVSLDYADETHGESRAVRNGFALAEKALRYYAERKDDFGYTFGVSTVLLKENLEHVPRVIALAREVGADRVGIQPVIDSQLRDAEAVDTAFSPAELDEVRSMLERLRARYGRFIGTSSMFLEAIPSYLRGPGEHTLSCFAGGTMVHIDPSGEVQPCMFKGSAGNIVDRPLREILDGAAYRQIRGEARRRECDDCLCPDIHEPNLLFSPGRWPDLAGKLLAKSGMAARKRHDSERGEPRQYQVQARRQRAEPASPEAPATKVVPGAAVQLGLSRDRSNDDSKSTELDSSVKAASGG